MNSPIQNLEGGKLQPPPPTSGPPFKNLPPTPPSSQQQQQQQQEIRVFTPVLSPSMQPRYLNSIQQAPQAPVMQRIPGNHQSISMDLSHHMTTTTSPSVQTSTTTNSRWNGYNATEQTKNFSLSAEAIQTHKETQARNQRIQAETQARNQQTRQLRHRRVQTARKIASAVLPDSMGAKDCEGGSSEIIIETKARELWMTVRDGLRLAAFIVVGFFVIWIAFTILLEYGAETRMLNYMETDVGRLYRPKLLSKLNPNFPVISGWVRRQAPAYFGNLKQNEANKGLDSIIQITAMMDPSEWGIGNWFSRLLGRLFFHKGLQQVKRKMLLRDLDLSLREAARETKLTCLCAAHVGIPLHAVLCQDTFMLEPVLETASAQTKTARIHDGVLSPAVGGAEDITEFKHDLASHVDYISKTGQKVRNTLDKDKTRCVTYCTKMAQRNIQ